jgi:tRNA (mo5U34)-methyltransferase
MTSPVAREALRERVAERDWYHTIELAPGVVTPGWYDLRGLPDRLPLPASLAGKRCLDIGTFDGFWAFELERRGADEVVAIDILDPERWDWPADSRPETIADVGRRKDGGAGFDIAREALGSSVERRELSVYDLDESVGMFDFVYLGSLLLHLRDPVRALERVRGVCRGQLLTVDQIDLPLTLAVRRRPVAYLDAVGRPWWWRPNQAAVVRMVEAAGFELADAPRRVFMRAGAGHPRPPLRLAFRHREARELGFAARFGAPHVAVLATPGP